MKGDTEFKYEFSLGCKLTRQKRQTENLQELVRHQYSPFKKLGIKERNRDEKTKTDCKYSWNIMHLQLNW